MLSPLSPTLCSSALVDRRCCDISRISVRLVVCIFPPHSTASALPGKTAVLHLCAPVCVCSTGQCLTSLVSWWWNISQLHTNCSLINVFWSVNSFYTLFRSYSVCRNWDRPVSSSADAVSETLTALTQHGWDCGYDGHHPHLLHPPLRLR